MDTRPGPDPEMDADPERALHGASDVRVPGQVRGRVGFSRGIDALGQRAARMGPRGGDRGAWASGAAADLLARVGLPLGAAPMTTTARLRAALKYPLFPP